ncbi:hypothetical protein RSAG8_10923, partial [Rhizoctonia solani AG-8 WAC10335]
MIYDTLLGCISCGLRRGQALGHEAPDKNRRSGGNTTLIPRWLASGPLYYFSLLRHLMLL